MKPPRFSNYSTVSEEMLRHELAKCQFAVTLVIFKMIKAPSVQYRRSEIDRLAAIEFKELVKQADISHHVCPSYSLPLQGVWHRVSYAIDENAEVFGNFRLTHYATDNHVLVAAYAAFVTECVVLVKQLEARKNGK